MPLELGKAGGSETGGAKEPGWGNMDWMGIGAGDGKAGGRDANEAV